MENSNIGWTHHTMNFWIGCTKVSAGCANCYAEADQADFRKRVVWGDRGTRSKTSYNTWRQMFRYDRLAMRAQEKQRVFISSLCDIFEDWRGPILDHNNSPLRWCDVGCMSDCEGIIDPRNLTVCPRCDRETRPLRMQDMRDNIFNVLFPQVPNLYKLLLTKRPQNVLSMVPRQWKQDWPRDVWIGTSVEDMASSERLKELARIPAPIRFVSFEPLLGPVNVLAGGQNAYSWAIVGGESGPHRRDCGASTIVATALSLRNIGCATYVKQDCALKSGAKGRIPDDVWALKDFPV